jgi:hypothetical protein
MNKPIEVWGLQQQCLIFGLGERRNSARGTEIFFGDCCIFAFAGFFLQLLLLLLALENEEESGLFMALVTTPFFYGYRLVS